MSVTLPASMEPPGIGASRSMPPVFLGDVPK